MCPDLAFVLGTRPEIIKLSPVIREAHSRGISFNIIHTGQHYSEVLDDVFFEQLRLPAPDYNLEIGSHLSGRQTGEMIVGIEDVLMETEPSVVLIQGDTNSVLAGAIASSKIDDLELGHVEAGLRCFNPDMPEEINRRVADHVADYHFAPTATARSNLLAENLPAESITVTGNTIVDAVSSHIRLAADQSTVLKRLDLDESFAILTAHREENVDDRDRFHSLLNGVATAAAEAGLQVYYPIHPRADQRIKEFDISVPPQIIVIDPLDFLDFLVLQDEGTLVFTDSGGVQEESCILQTPCVTLRDETERPETVEVGANTVVGTDHEAIVEGARTMLDVQSSWEVPFGDGTAAEAILDTLEVTGDGE